MKRTPVSSSSLASVGYDPATQTLEVEFVHGAVYRYFDVPKSEHRALMAAKSHGSYFVHEIKDSYSFEHVR
jgi:hypothetical protein